MKTKSNRFIIRYLKKTLIPAFLIFVIFLANLGFEGYVIAKSFKGPGYDVNKGVTFPGTDSVLVGLTYAVTGDDSELNNIFFEHVKKVEESLQDRSGFIGYSIRKQLFGNEVWTMTVWDNKYSMQSFVESDVHKEAMKKGMTALKTTRFYRFFIKKEAIPISWEKAEKLVKTEGYGY